MRLGRSFPFQPRLGEPIVRPFVDLGIPGLFHIRASLAAVPRMAYPRRFPLPGWVGTQGNQSNPVSVSVSPTFADYRNSTLAALTFGTATTQKVARIFNGVPADPGTDVQVSAAIFKLNAPTDNVVVEIQSDSGGLPSGTVLGSASIVGSSLPSSLSNFEQTVSITVTGGLDAATTYWVVFRRDGAVDPTNDYELLGGASHNVGYGYNGSTWSALPGGSSGISDVALVVVGNAIVSPAALGAVSRNLGPKPPAVVTNQPSSSFTAPPITRSLAGRPSRFFPNQPELRTPIGLSPLAQTTTPGQLRVTVTLAGRTRAETARREPQSRLAPPSVVVSAAVQTFSGPEVTLAGRTRLDQQRRSGRAILSAPTALRVFAAAAVTLARIRPRPTRTLLRPPTVLRVPAIEQQEQTIRASLAAESRVERLRRRTTYALSGPVVVNPPPLAPPEQIELVAVRRRTERQRREFTASFLRPPTVVRVPSVEQQQQTIKATLAPSPRQDRAPHSKLSRPTVVRIPSVEQAEDTVRVAIARIRPRPTTTKLARPTAVRVPSVEQQQQTLRIALAPSPRQDREPVYRLYAPTVVLVPSVEQAEDTIRVALARIRPARTASLLRPPSALRVFPGAKVALARVRARPTRTFLRPPTVVRVPSVEQAEDTIRVALAASPRQDRAPHSRLAAPTILRVPSVELAEDTVRVALARIRPARTGAALRLPIVLQVFAGARVTLARIRPRPTRVFLRPPTVVRVPSVEQQQQTIRTSLAASPRQDRTPHSRLSAPPTIIRIPSVEQAEDTIRVALAPSPRQDRAPHSRLDAPRVVRVPSVEQQEDTVRATLARIRPPRTRAFLRPPTVVRVPSVEQAEDTIRVTLAAESRVERIRRRTTYALGGPVVVNAPPHYGPNVTLAGRTRLEASRRPSRAFLRPPTAVLVPSVELAQQTVRTALAAEKTIELRRRAANYFLRAPLLPPVEARLKVALARTAVSATLSTLRPPTAVATPPPPREEGVSTFLVAARTAAEQSLHQPRSRLSAPTVLQTFAASSVSLAGQARLDLRRRAPLSKLSPPTVVATPQPPREEGVSTQLAATRVAGERTHRPASYALRPPTVVTTPTPPTRQQQTITETLATRPPTERPRRAPRYVVRPPIVVAPFVPPVTPTGGIGGSGMSDEEYERLLRRLGALPKKLDLQGLELDEAMYVLRMLGLL